MNNFWLVFKREYLFRIKNKWFWITTFMIPLGILLIYLIPILLISFGEQSKTKLLLLNSEKYLKEEQIKPQSKNLSVDKVEGSLDEAKSKVNSYLEMINKSKQEIERLIRLAGGQGSKVDVEELKKELERLAQANLDKATFTEKRDIINKLGIGVYPSEDLKTMKIRCSLNFSNNGNTQPSDGCVIIQFATLRSQ